MVYNWRKHVGKKKVVRITPYTALWVDVPRSTIVSFTKRFRRLYLLMKNDTRRQRYEKIPKGTPLPYSYYDLATLALKTLKSGRCHYCSCRLTVGNLSPDHRVAMYSGGTSNLSNIRIICLDCNLRKGILSETEFRDIMLTA